MSSSIPGTRRPARARALPFAAARSGGDSPWWADETSRDETGPEAPRTMKESKVNDPAPASPTPEDHSGFDQEDLLDQLNGNLPLLIELAELFIVTSGLTIGELRDAIRRGDAGQVQRLAHRLKGSGSTFGADRAMQAADALERMGAARMLTGVDALYADLEREIRLLVAELTLLRQGRGG